MSDAACGALSGLRVLDFSRVLAGPLATMYFADLGADVIKVESPEGDETRQWLPPVDASGRSSYFTSVNRNKRSLALDLKSTVGRRTAFELADGADVVIENFRPGVMERLGLGYEELFDGNPRLVYASITGFGREQGAALPGYDLIVQAVGGLMSVTGAPDGAPMKVGVAVVDVMAGLNAVIGVQAALAERERSGIGQRVDVTLLQSLLSGLANLSAATLATSRAPTRLGNAHPSIAPYESFPTGHGDLVVAVGNDRQFEALAAAVDAPALSADPLFGGNPARVRNRDRLRQLLVERFAHRSADEWADILNARGVPAGRVNDIAEALRFASDIGTYPVVTLPDRVAPVPTIASPVSLSRTPVTYCSTAPEPTTELTWLEM